MSDETKPTEAGAIEASPSAPSASAFSDIEGVVRGKVLKAEGFVSTDKLYFARDEYNAIRKYLDECLKKCGDQETKRLIEQLKDEVFSTELFKFMDEQMKLAEEVIHDLVHEDGWEIVKESGGFTTMHREEPALNSHSFRVCGKVNVSIFNILAVIYEIDLFPNWFPFVDKSKLLGTPTRFRKFTQVRAKLPWPLTSREAIMDGYGVDNIDEGYVLVIVKSALDALLDDNNEEQPLPKETRDAVRVIVHRGGFLFKIIDENSTYVSFLLNADPKMPAIPFWLLNMITGQFIHVLLSRMEKAANFDDDSEYSRRIKANREIYGYLEEQRNQKMKELAEARLNGGSSAGSPNIVLESTEVLCTTFLLV